MVQTAAPTVTISPVDHGQALDDAGEGGADLGVFQVQLGPFLGHAGFGQAGALLEDGLAEGALLQGVHLQLQQAVLVFLAGDGAAASRSRSSSSRADGEIRARPAWFTVKVSASAAIWLRACRWR